MSIRILGLPSDIGEPGKPIRGPIVRSPIRAVGTYRIKQPLDSIAQLGLAEVDYYSAGYPLVFELVREFDVVIMQRQTMLHHITLAEHVSILLENLAVYDFDDDLLNLDKMNPAYVFWGTDKDALWSAFCKIRDGAPGQVDPRLQSVNVQQIFHRAQQIRAGFAEMLKAVDLVTVSTPYLKAKYSGDVPGAVEIIPNGVKLEDWEVEPTEIPGVNGRLVIGWAGGQSHERDLRMVVRPLVSILEQFPDTVLAFVGWPGAVDLFPERCHERIFTQPFMKMDRYRTYVKGFDIGIAPAAAVPQNFGKSPIRVLELGACSIPVVASETTYADYVPPGAGYVAKTVRQFGVSLRKLIRAGEQKRQQMGVQLFDYVSATHEAQVVGRLAAEVYAEHLGRKRNGRC